MTAPLFADRDPCGCERALGHVCRVPFARSDDWPLAAELQRNEPGENGMIEAQNNSAPVRRTPAGATDNLVRGNPHV